MAKPEAAHAGSFPLAFHSMRNISSPEDVEAKRRRYGGTVPYTAILEIPNDENVREYLPTAQGKQRKTKTAVHREMEQTLHDRPQDFGVLNGGLAIVSREVSIDDAHKTAYLKSPSLINGAQTQGVLKEYYEENLRRDRVPFPVSVHVEIIVTLDEDLIADVSIARNSQNAVDIISIVGRKGHLDDIGRSMFEANPLWKIRKSESDYGDVVDGFVPTEKLIMVLWAMVPPHLWPNARETENPSKAYTWVSKARCLRDFEKLYVAAHGGTVDKMFRNADREFARELYRFFVDAAPFAWSTYLRWKAHPDFAGSRLQDGITRDGSDIVDVADAIVFPILAALSVFVEHTAIGWTLVVPTTVFEEAELVDTVKILYRSRSIAHSAWALGKSADAWTQIYMTTAQAKRMAIKVHEKFGVTA